MCNGTYRGKLERLTSVTKTDRWLTRRRLQAEATRLGIEVHRRVFSHIRDSFRAYPRTTAVFNCTGIGALTLGGVEDEKVYSARVCFPKFHESLH